MCAKLHTVAASNNRDHASQSLLLLLVRATHIYCCSSYTSRSWWITQSTQRHWRGCNTTMAQDSYIQWLGEALGLLQGSLEAFLLFHKRMCWEIATSRHNKHQEGISGTVRELICDWTIYPMWPSQ